MTTSAQALNQLLSVANKHPNKNDKFLKVVAAHLGLLNKSAEVEVIQLLVRLLDRIDADIETMNVGEEEKTHARKFLGPFANIRNFSHLHLNIQQAKDNFLKADHLVGLMSLHLALSGHTNYFDLDSETKKYAEDVRRLRDEMLDLDLPTYAKKIVTARLAQIASMLENFYAFGPDALQAEIEALVGAIVVNPPNKDSKASASYGRTVAVLLAILAGLKSVDSALGATLSMSEKGKALLELYSPDD